jgi:polygalacturonase
MSLLYAYNEENIKICGGHLISDEERFWLKTGDKESFESALTCMPWHFYRCTPEMNRPRMLLFEDCKNIKIQDLFIEKSPVYSGWFLGCENICISGIYIKNNYAGPNSDGLHFSSCKDVRITDSVFICGDDCIAIDPNHRNDSEAFTINGCIFDTSVHAFRIYTGLDYSIMYNCGGSRAVGTVKNITISNCIIRNACGIFDINAENGSLENISLSNIAASLEWEGTSFILSTNNGKIKNIIMNGMTIKGNGCGIIWGDKPGSIEDVLIDNTIMEITPKTKINASYVPDFPNWCHLRPNNFKIKYSKNIIFSNLEVKWNEPVYSDKWNEDRRNKVIERVGIKTLETMEPKCFKAFDIEESKDISFINVSADDFNINF